MKLSSIALLLVPRFFSIGKRTWAGIGMGILLLAVLIVWAGISSVSWLWGQAPAVAESGKRVASLALGQAEQSIPGVREQVEQYAPDLRKQIAEVVPGVREQLAIWLPAATDSQAEPRDVSGTDIGPVARFPGLGREKFQRDERGMSVLYGGRAEFQPVLNHYVQGFSAAGYRQEIISATRENEHHRYTKGTESVELIVAGKPNREIVVELKSTY